MTRRGTANQGRLRFTSDLDSSIQVVQSKRAESASCHFKAGRHLRDGRVGRLDLGEAQIQGVGAGSGKVECAVFVHHDSGLEVFGQSTQDDLAVKCGGDPS